MRARWAGASADEQHGGYAEGDAGEFGYKLTQIGVAKWYSS